MNATLLPFAALLRRRVAQPLWLLALLLFSLPSWAQVADGTLSPANLTVCAGINSGTLTLSGNTGAIVKFQADNGSGYVDIANSANLTYTFNNLSITTHYRAVTQHGTSSVATVTVNQPPTATINSSGPTSFCQRGTITLVAGPGGPGYTYQFLLGGRDINGATSQTYSATVTSNGQYSVRVTDANGCSSTSSALTIRVNAQSVVTLSSGGTTVCQGGSVPLTATVSGTGSGNYSYQYYLNGNPIAGAISPTYAATQSGSYTVVVTNPTVCTSTSNAINITVTSAGTATLSYPSALYCQTTSLSTTPTASPSGGTFAVTSGGSGLVLNTTTGVINASQSSAGTYTITYTGGAPCPATATATVQIRNAPTTAFTYPAGSPCAGLPGTLTPTLAPGSNSGTFTATPNGASITPSTGVINLQASLPGTYRVTNSVGANNGCAATSSSVTIVLSATPIAAITTNGPTTFCQGGNVILTATGGAAGATYQFLNNGQPISGATASTYTANTNGSYSVTITNIGGCAATSAATVVTVNPGTTSTFSYSPAAFCQNVGTTPTPTVTGTTGGTFSAPIGLIINAVTGSINLAQSTPGTYAVTYTVGGSCTSTSSVNVTVNAAPAAALTASGPTTFCQGSNVVLTATGGAPGATYQFLNNGQPISGSTAATYTASASGSYSVTITNSTGCANTSAVTAVTVNPQTTATFSYPAAAFCQNAGTTPTPTVTGTTGGTFSAPTGLAINAGTGTINLAQSTPGIYAVTYAVAGSCPSTATTTITINAAPAAAITTSGPTTFCQGSSVTLTATGGAVGATYQFLLNGQPITGGTGITYVASASGAYSVSITNGTGCTNTSAATTVTVNPQTTAGFSYGAGAYCQNAANPSPTITGTQGGSFSGSASGLVIAVNTGVINLAQSTPGTYTVTYNVAGPCPSSSTASVTITAPATAGFSYAAPTYCTGGSNPSPTLATGATAGVFTAIPAGLTINPSTGAINLTSSQAGSYTVTNTVAAAGGCPSATATASVSIGAQPVATLAASGPTTFCQGGSVTLTANGGIASSVYQFLLNGQPISGATSASYTASASGSYSVNITNTGICAATSASIVVTINPIATPTLSYSAASFCQGSGIAAATVSGGATGGSFTASGTGLVLDAASGSIDLAQSQPGTYTVSYTGGSPCPGTVTASVTITATPSAAFAYSGGATFCPTATDPTPTITGATGGIFSAPTGLVIDAATGTINLQTSTAGTYSVTYAVAGPCPASSSLNVTITTAPAASFGYASATGYCAGIVGMVTPSFTGGGSAGTFAATPSGLSMNASTGAIDLSQSQAGTYTVTNTIAASGACSAISATASVTINPAPTATLTAGGPTTFCQGGSVMLTAPADPTASYQFLNNGQPITGATSASYSATAAGNYSVTVTNASGCSATSTSTVVTVNPITTASFSYPLASLCTSNPSALTPTITGTSGGSFSATPTGLSLDANTGTITPGTSTAGTFTVTYAVAGACPSSSTASVTVTSPGSAGFSYAQASYCPTGTASPALASGATAGTFAATPNGLSINATTGAIDFSLSQPGTYAITNTIPASGGCAAITASTSVVVNPATTASFSYASSSLCTSATSASTPTISGTTGGTFTAAPASLIIDGATGAITPGTSTAGTYTITYAVGGPCPSSSTATVTITTPGTAGFSYAQASYCPSGSATPTLATGATAGAFAATPTGLSLNATTGAVDFSLSQPGTYTVTNTIPASSGCAAVTASVSLIVNPATTASFNYAATSLCASATTAATPTVTGTTGGVFSATPAGLVIDPTSGAILPSASTVGTYTVTYTVSNPCPSSSTATITITTSASAAFTFAQSSYCPSGTATPTLGTGSGTGTFTASPAGLSLNASTGAVDFSLSQPGSYTVTNTIAASGGCAAATATASLTVNPAPAQPVLTYTGNTLSATPTTGVTYQYYLNGTAIAGATAATYTPTQNGSYTVVVTSVAGCGSVASVAQVVTITAVRSAQTAFDLTVYPNPTADGLLTLTLAGASQPTTLSVLNALGQEVLSTNLTGDGNHALDMSKLATGVYVLRATTSTGSAVRRVVRQ